VSAENVAGRMTGLTLFTPVRRQWHWFLWIGLKVTRHLPFMARHILQFNFIKFVRWTVVPGLDGEKLHHPYLFFESNFDGPWQHYIDAFAYVIPRDIWVTWGRGPGFPAPPPAEPLKAWIAMNSMEGGTYYCAHADFSTREVNNAIAVRSRLEALQRAAAGMDPATFKAEWERFLSDAQAHL
jgi:hypothetical protein